MKKYGIKIWNQYMKILVRYLENSIHPRWYERKDRIKECTLMMHHFAIAIKYILVSLKRQNKNKDKTIEKAKIEKISLFNSVLAKIERKENVLFLPS